MADQPAFFLKNVVDYARVMRARDGTILSKALFFLGYHQELKYRDSATPIVDPLNAQYWSKLPYQLGPGQVIKFTSKPCTFAEMKSPEPNIKNYMQDEMKKHLEKEDVCFQFSIQRRMEGSDQDVKMPIEDASVEWPEDISSFQKVAEIHIPKGQAFYSDAEQAACEKLSFNPWHALSEQRPLGNLNRVRKVVYEVSSRYRREHNALKEK
jgi:hypothetical protein